MAALVLPAPEHFVQAVNNSDKEWGTGHGAALAEWVWDDTARERDSALEQDVLAREQELVVQAAAAICPIMVFRTMVQVISRDPHQVPGPDLTAVSGQTAAAPPIRMG